MPQVVECAWSFLSLLGEPLHRGVDRGLLQPLNLIRTSPNPPSPPEIVITLNFGRTSSEHLLPFRPIHIHLQTHRIKFHRNRQTIPPGTLCQSILIPTAISLVCTSVNTKGKHIWLSGQALGLEERPYTYDPSASCIDYENHNEPDLDVAAGRGAVCSPHYFHGAVLTLA